MHKAKITLKGPSGSLGSFAPVAEISTFESPAYKLCVVSSDSRLDVGFFADIQSHCLQLCNYSTLCG
jgi:hypothetical protein